MCRAVVVGRSVGRLSSGWEETQRTLVTADTIALINWSAFADKQEGSSWNVGTIEKKFES